MSKSTKPQTAKQIVRQIAKQAKVNPNVLFVEFRVVLDAANGLGSVLQKIAFSTNDAQTISSTLAYTALNIHEPGALADYMIQAKAKDKKGRSYKPIRSESTERLVTLFFNIMNNPLTGISKDELAEALDVPKRGFELYRLTRVITKLCDVVLGVQAGWVSGRYCFLTYKQLAAIHARKYKEDLGRLKASQKRADALKAQGILPVSEETLTLSVFADPKVLEQPSLFGDQHAHH